MDSLVASKTFKIVLIGDSGVGKTAIVTQYTKNLFKECTQTSIGAASFQKIQAVDGQLVNLNIWDTAGQERFRSLARMYFNKASVVILVYDTTCQSSFKHLSDWLNQADEATSKQAILVLIGNKADLEAQVTEEEAENLAAVLGAMNFRVSARNLKEVQGVFEAVARKLVEAPPESVPAAIELNLQPSSRQRRCC